VAGERSTAERIVEAAEVLFAERGFEATTTTAIIEAAGARNKSAVAYHFGSKVDLLEAVLARHTAALDERRDALLDAIEAAGDAPTLEAAVDAMISPLVSMLGDPSGERYLQIQAGLLSYRNRDTLPALASDPGRRMVRLQRVLADVLGPRRRSAAVNVLVPSLLFHGLADFARSGRSSRRERDEFVAALRIAVAAILRDASR
jgi:AcrR family transcriptional regulator